MIISNIYILHGTLAFQTHHTKPHTKPNHHTTLSLPLPSSHFLIFISPLIPPMFHVKHLAFPLSCPLPLFLYLPILLLLSFPIYSLILSIHLSYYHITPHTIYYHNPTNIYSYLTLPYNNNKFLSNSCFHFHNQTIHIDQTKSKFIINSTQVIYKSIYIFTNILSISLFNINRNIDFTFIN